MADVVQLGETPEKKADYIKKSLCMCGKNTQTGIMLKDKKVRQVTKV